MYFATRNTLRKISSHRVLPPPFTHQIPMQSRIFPIWTYILGKILENHYVIFKKKKKKGHPLKSLKTFLNTPLSRTTFKACRPAPVCCPNRYSDGPCGPWTFRRWSWTRWWCTDGCSATSGTKTERSTSSYGIWQVTTRAISRIPKRTERCTPCDPRNLKTPRVMT